jgi:hypothetical protein
VTNQQLAQAIVRAVRSADQSPAFYKDDKRYADQEVKHLLDAHRPEDADEAS